MSRQDYPAALARALDRYDVPPLSPGFADRLVSGLPGQGALPPVVPPRRAGRGAWRRAGQAAIAVVALGTMSAAAVASGLLQAAGIEVPVLSAMLAPKPVAAAPARPARVAQAKPRPKPAAAAPAPPPVVEPAPPPIDPIAARRAAMREAFLARQAARRADREAFLARHPGLREAVAAGPEARRAYLQDHPEVAAEVRARLAAKRAELIERRRARLAAMTPDERAAFFEAQRTRFEARREWRRMRRAELQRQMDIPGEGNGDPAR